MDVSGEKITLKSTQMLWKDKATAATVQLCTVATDRGISWEVAKNRSVAWLVANTQHTHTHTHTQHTSAPVHVVSASLTNRAIMGRPLVTLRLFILRFENPVRARYRLRNPGYVLVQIDFIHESLRFHLQRLHDTSFLTGSARAIMRPLEVKYVTFVNERR